MFRKMFQYQQLNKTIFYTFYIISTINSTMHFGYIVSLYLLKYTCWIRSPFFSQCMVGDGVPPASHSNTTSSCRVAKVTSSNASPLNDTLQSAASPLFATANKVTTAWSKANLLTIWYQNSNSNCKIPPSFTVYKVAFCSPSVNWVPDIIILLRSVSNTLRVRFVRLSQRLK